VLVLLERVSEAQRLAAKELKEVQSSEGGGRGQRKRKIGVTVNDELPDEPTRTETTDVTSTKPRKFKRKH
jgi:hypothetical protein